MSTIVSIIAAHDDNLGIGKNNQLPWQISADLKRFKKITSGHPVIMGRITYESIGKPLSNRHNIIITRDKNYSVSNCQVVHSLKEAIKLAKTNDNQEIFIIGGGEIYKQALPLANKLYLTHVYGDFNCDTFFPDYPNFNLVKKTKHSEGQQKFVYLTLVK